MAPRRTYRTADPVPESVQAALVGHDTLMQRLLHTRGISKADAAATFLEPDYESSLHDPFLLTDMETAVARILAAIKKSERIAIYSDYDCDGIPGGVVLHDFFKAIGYDNFVNYIPHRHDEGFGLSVDAVEKLADDGTSLIITIDCGTADVVPIERANERGVDVIVTDHHEPNGTLPPACTLLNPKRDDAYPFPHLCGAGVVFKLVQALKTRGGEAGQFELPDGQEKWLLDMVGLATIADMVPLIGENRVFAKYGLLVLRKSRRPGLQHLLKRGRVSQRELTEDDIGFIIGPRINAASRMDTPEDAFYMLASTDEAEAGGYVDHLERLNNERKGVVAAMTKEIKKRMKGLGEIPSVIVLGNPEWRPALVGLAANSLAEEYQRPVFLWGRDGRGVIKGSCRSDGETSVITLMDRVKDAFIEYGGHHGSGGFSVTDEAIHTLLDELNDSYRSLGEKAKTDNLTIVDADLSLREVDETLLRTLRALAPFGAGNPKPVFRFIDVEPAAVETFGKSGEHTKLIFDDGQRLEAIAFFTALESFTREPKVGEPVTLIAHVEESFFMNKKQTRLRIIDVI